jgi:hypothetical protein
MTKSLALALLLSLPACTKENNVSIGNGVEPEVMVPADPPEPGLIDNLEYRRDSEIPEWEERVGYWFSYIDQHPDTELEPQTSVPGFEPKDLYFGGGADETKTAVLLAGKTGAADTPGLEPTAEVYGGGIGIHVAGGDAYDAASHGYTGVTFWARKLPTSNLTEIGVKFPETRTWTDCEVCLDHFEMHSPVTNSWTKYTVPFAGSAQEGFGDPVDALDPSHLIGVVWTVPPGKTVELLIDEVSFSSD